jgi:uncharacterized protein YkwD
VSRVLLGRATRCVGAAALAVAFLCCAGPGLGKSSAGISSEGPGLSGLLPLGSATVSGVSATPNQLAAPRASASRACAYENTSVRRASAAELRSAVVCLINRFRSRGGLPWLHQQNQLDSAAQGHDNQMVADRYFGHGGIGGSSPASRISAAGFRWGAYGEAISTGFKTPHQAVSAWLRSVVHCRILLSPLYRYIGIGVSSRSVAGWTRRPGTWTADLALPIGWASPSRSWTLADGCPY